MPTYSVANNGRLCTVKLMGDLLVTQVSELQEALKGAVDGGAMEIVFDFGAVNLLDSSGIGLLIAAGNSLAQKQGKISMVNVSADILKLLQSMRLVGRLNARGK